MLIVHVHIHVKQESIDAFKKATIENAEKSIEEPGIARFDLMQREDDPDRFVLVEAYRTVKDPARHKETAHYAQWRDTVEPMMAEPRRSLKYMNLFPHDRGW